MVVLAWREREGTRTWDDEARGGGGGGGGAARPTDLVWRCEGRWCEVVGVRGCCWRAHWGLVVGGEVDEVDAADEAGAAAAAAAGDRPCWSARGARPSERDLDGVEVEGPRWTRVWDDDDETRAGECESQARSRSHEGTRVVTGTTQVSWRWPGAACEGRRPSRLLCERVREWVVAEVEVDEDGDEVK